MISIIALLISILLPALGSAREEAKAIQCAANMHQLGVAFGVYGAGEEGYFPPTGAPNNSPGITDWAQGSAWYVGFINNQVNTKLGLYCPTQPSRISDVYDHVHHTPDPTNSWFLANGVISYGYNSMHIGSSARYGGGTTPAKLSQLTKPSKTLILADSVIWFLSEGYYRIDDVASTINQPHPYGQHPGDGMTVLYADGHAVRENTDNNDPLLAYATLGEGWTGTAVDPNSVWGRDPN